MGLDVVSSLGGASVHGGLNLTGCQKLLRDLGPCRDKSITQSLQIFFFLVAMSVSLYPPHPRGALCPIWPLWRPLPRTEPAVKMPTLVPESCRLLGNFFPFGWRILADQQWSELTTSYMGSWHSVPMFSRFASHVLTGQDWTIGRQSEADDLASDN